MDNMILFANSFVSYLVCFFVFVLAIVIASFIGIAIRKNKNKNLEVANATDVVTDSQANN